MAAMKAKWFSKFGRKNLGNWLSPRLFQTTTTPSRVVGVEIGQEGIALCEVLKTGTTLTCPQAEFVRASTQSAFAQALQDFVRRHALQDSACAWVLHPNDYRLLLVDRPKVLESEIASAVRWTLKDRIHFPLEQAIVDIFLPDLSILPQRDKVYVAVAQKTYLQSLSDLFTQAKLKLTSITMQEIALRNWLEHSQAPSAALLQLWPKTTLFLCTEQSSIRMIRTINLGIDHLQDPLLWVKWQEEITRSLKYYTEQLKQISPQALYYAPVLTETRDIITSLSARHPPISYFPCSSIMQINSQVDDHEKARCFAGIGAALGALQQAGPL